MASLVDVKIDEGNGAAAAKELAAEAAAAATDANKDKSAAATARPTENKQAGGDPRFEGKSREDILDMYRNLESHQGRLANELGQTKRTLDELLVDKRARDLNANGAATDDINPTDLLVKPKEVLDKYVNARAEALVAPLQQKLTNLEQALLNNTFNARHTDVNEVTSSPDFKAWVLKTPLRQQMAAQAAKGNVQVADALLTEFKESHKAAGKGGGNANLAAALKAADAASLEGNGASDPAARPAGKTYKRDDIINLRMRNPDEYERLSPIIQKAYAEGRVVA